jgi:hypothetical protein
MGGSINVAIRFENGETVCQDQWTNYLPSWFRDPKMLEDETLARAFCAATSTKEYMADPTTHGRPQPVENNSYGLLVWDYATKSILDNNTYCPLLEFDLVQTGGRMRSDEFVACAAAGRIIMEVLERRSLNGVLARLTYEEALAMGEQVWLESRQRTPEHLTRFLVDPSPMTYQRFEVSPSGTEAMRAKLRELDFPMSRKAGLNKTLPKITKRIAESSRG